VKITKALKSVPVSAWSVAWRRLAVTWARQWLSGDHRRDFAVRRSVWYRLGHHEQLYRYCPDADHQPGGGCAGYRGSAAGDGIGLFAAIPAVVIYNIFARMIGSYKASLGDVAAQVLLLQSRDLDLSASGVKPVRTAQKLRVG
jgi:hypothetical protein